MDDNTPTGDNDNFLVDHTLSPEQSQYLMHDLYPDLKRIAFSHLSKESQGHTLTPTAVVHETFLKLYSMKYLKWFDKKQFMALCSLQMRRILTDYAKHKNAARRGGQDIKITLYEEQLSGQQTGFDLQELNEVLNKLGGFSKDLETIVELRFFGGFNNQEIADHFDVNVSTVKRKWNMAKAWLYKELSHEKSL